jgi:monoamine oxidase
MLEIAIVGGGLTGLAVANLLRTEGEDFRLFEGRSRLGGRIFTVEEPSGLALDLGATWFWPAENPLLAGLLRALALESFEQYDAGQFVLAPRDGGPVRRMPGSGCHAGAHRIVGGVGTLVTALATRLPAERIRLAHELVAVALRAEHVELTMRSEATLLTVRARAVVLAIPPRLIEQRVRFDPPLAPALKSALREAPTWMAPHAKALVPYAEPSWRRAGDSGNAQAAHAGAVLGEVFDACDRSERAALGGFLALDWNERWRSREDLPRLVTDHLAALFGRPAQEAGPVLIQDWATELFTATALDLDSPPRDPVPAGRLLAAPHWHGRLFFGAAETAPMHPGHLEGALESAVHLAELVTRVRVPVRAADPAGRAESEWLARFRDSLRSRRSRALDVYRDFIQEALSHQDFEELTRRAVLQAAAMVYRGALADLAVVCPAECALAPHALAERVDAVLAPLAGFADELLLGAIRSNRTSCAMQNFPFEVQPDTDYIQTIAHDLHGVFDEFRRAVERTFRARAGSSGSSSPML